MGGTKVCGVVENVSISNIKEYPSIVGRANGSTALASAKIVSSIIGKWTLMKKLKTQLGLTYMMDFKVTDAETTFPIVESTLAEVNSPQLSFDSVASLLLAEEENSPYSSISDYYAAYRNDKSTPSVVVEKILDFYNSDGAKTINSIFEFHDSEMREAANESEKRLQEGNPRSILEGIPFVVKEEIPISGYKSVKGLGNIDNNVETETNPIVQRLLDAGAILVGTTKMTQMGYGTLGPNPAELYGAVKNPCNPEFYIGGSSGGTAASVCSGFVPFGIAVDCLGSGRIPAALSGIVGFKPTFTRVVNSGKFTELPYAVISPMTSNVRDASIVYGFISGAISNCKYGLNQPLVDLPILKKEFELKTVRFGHDELFTKACYTDEIINAVFGVAAELKNEGCEIQNYCIPEAQETVAAMTACIIKQNQVEFANKMGDGVEGKINCVNATILYALAKCIDDKELAQSRRQRTRAMLIVKEMFEKFDIFISPSTGTLAPKIELGDEKYGVLDDVTSSRMIRYCAIGSLTGIPSIVLNIGKSSDNLPISVQLSAAWWNEKLLLEVGYKLEQIYSKEKRNPKIFNKII